MVEVPFFANVDFRLIFGRMLLREKFILLFFLLLELILGEEKLRLRSTFPGLTKGFSRATANDVNLDCLGDLPLAAVLVSCLLRFERRLAMVSFFILVN